MQLTFLLNVCRHLVVLLLAAILALSASYAPVVLDGLASTTLTTTVFACGPQVVVVNLAFAREDKLTSLFLLV